MSANPRLMNKEQRDVVLNLWIADQQTGHPTLSADEAPIARDWLGQVLTDGDKLGENIGLLSELSHTAIRPPTPRRDRPEGEPPPARSALCRCEPLAEDHLHRIAENGLDELTDEDLPRLLLNPFDLYDLADLVATLLPDCWMDALADAGRSIIQRHDLVITLEPPARRPVPALRGETGRMRQGDSLPFRFTAGSTELKRRMAASLYGDADRDFVLTLHRRLPAPEGGIVVELEVSPAPVNEDLKLVVAIQGHERTFVLAVPPSVRLDPDAEPPDSIFARASEPLPEEALSLDGKVEGREDAWPPYLVLRCRIGLLTTGRE